MAITKVHPIRKTLGKAIDYIINPDKIPDDMLISTFGCTKESAEYMFLSTKQKGNARCLTLAQHVIQSFAPGETDAKTAHEIGVKLVNSFTNSQHEYVIATHVDKEHIHNHIIFNHTNFVTHNAFRMNMSSYKELRKKNDSLCQEYGLSIIENPKKKGITKYEWMMKKKGLSYKKNLQDNIDICINSSNSFDEFLSNMQKLGYEIKHGKYIAFRKNEQERFVRSKSLGIDYTEESIKSRIKEHPPVKLKTSSSYVNSIGLIRNMNNYISAMENPIYRQKVALSNIKKLSATYNYLVANNIDSYESLTNELAKTKSEIKELRSSIREIEDKIHSTSELLLHVNRLNEHKEIYKKYKASKHLDSFYEAHYSEIILYESSMEYLKHHKEINTSTTPSVLHKNLSILESTKYESTKKYKILTEQLKELEMVNKNVGILFSEKENTKKYPPPIR